MSEKIVASFSINKRDPKKVTFTSTKTEPVKANFNIHVTPSKVSQLQNDLGFVNAEEVLILTDTYIHEQSLASSEWIIEHNLHKRPSVTVVDSAGTVVVPDVDYINDDVIIVRSKGKFKGTAYLN